jgi:hypothetical protein
MDECEDLETLRDDIHSRRQFFVGRLGYAQAHIQRQFGDFLVRLSLETRDKVHIVHNGPTAFREGATLSVLWAWRSVGDVKWIDLLKRLELIATTDRIHRSWRFVASTSHLRFADKSVLGDSIRSIPLAREEEKSSLRRPRIHDHGLSQEHVVNVEEGVSRLRK